MLDSGDGKAKLNPRQVWTLMPDWIQKKKKNLTNSFTRSFFSLFKRVSIFFPKCPHGIVTHLCDTGRRRSHLFTGKYEMWFYMNECSKKMVSKPQSDWVGFPPFWYFWCRMGAWGLEISSSPWTRSPWSAWPTRRPKACWTKSKLGERCSFDFTCDHSRDSRGFFFHGLSLSSCLFPRSRLCVATVFCPQARRHSGNRVHPWERAFSKQRVSAQWNPATHGQQLPLRPLKSAHQITWDQPGTLFQASWFLIQIKTKD